MLHFRDWLRNKYADSGAYMQIKRHLAQRTRRHVQHYADAKTTIVEQIIARATRAGPDCTPASGRAISPANDEARTDARLIWLGPAVPD
jgi:GrpB protein